MLESTLTPYYLIIFELGTVRKAFCTNRTLLYGTHIQYIYTYCKCKQHAHWYNLANASIRVVSMCACVHVFVRVCVFIRVTCCCPSFVHSATTGQRWDEKGMIITK